MGVQLQLARAGSSAENSTSPAPRTKRIRRPRGGFILIWGRRVTHTRDAHFGPIYRVCPGCKRHSQMVGMIVQRWFTLFFCPISTIGSPQRYAQCQSCGGKFTGINFPLVPGAIAPPPLLPRTMPPAQSKMPLWAWGVIGASLLLVLLGIGATSYDMVHRRLPKTNDTANRMSSVSVSNASSSSSSRWSPLPPPEVAAKSPVAAPVVQTPLPIKPSRDALGIANAKAPQSPIAAPIASASLSPKPSEGALALANITAANTRGHWSFSDEGLTNNAGPGWIEIPFDLRGSYELEMKFTRHGNKELILNFPAGVPAQLWLGGWIGQTSSLEGTPLRTEEHFFDDNKLMTLILRVIPTASEVTITTTLNGKPYLSWTGAQSSLRTGKQYRPAMPTHLALFVHGGSKVTFHSIHITAIAGAERDGQ